MSKGKLLGWWFEPAAGVLGYEDGRKPRKGATHKVKGQPVLCEFGLHASVNPLDALKYAQSTNVWRVELGGVIVRGDDKATATERRYLWRIDAESVLRAFARRCALDVIHLWDAPPVVVEYLKTGDETLVAAARAAVWAATGAGAGDWAAARSAARAASGDWSGDWDAAVAARAAVWAAQNKRLRVLLNREAKRLGVAS